jgi:hypothetical protein
MILVIEPQFCNCWPSISRYNMVLWLLEFSMQPHCILLVGVYTLASKFQGPNTERSGADDGHDACRWDVRSCGDLCNVIQSSMGDEINAWYNRCTCDLKAIFG